MGDFQQQHLEIERERKLWCKCIVTAQVLNFNFIHVAFNIQIYLFLLSLTIVHYLFNPFKLSLTVVIVITAVICTISSVLLIVLCIYFCRPTKEVLRPVPMRKLTAASVETDPAFWIGGTLE